MFIILIKTVLIYCITILTMRIMGKKQAGQLQPYELVITLMIAEVASTPMDSPGTPISYGLVPAVTLLILYFIFTFLTLKSKKLRIMLCGRPNILIHNGKILYHELRKSNYSLNDLVEQLRINGNTNISEIHYAILETNGQLSVLPYAENCPVTSKDLSLNTRDESAFISVVMDGELSAWGVDQMKLTEVGVERILNQLGHAGVSEILLLALSDSGEVFLQDKQGNTQTIHLSSKIIRECGHETV